MGTKRKASGDDGSPRPAKKSSATVSEYPSTGIDGEGEQYIALSKMRRVGISTYNGQTLVSMREYYEKDGKMMPTKKGISLSIDQYCALVKSLPEIETMLGAKVADIPRPDYGGLSKEAASSSTPRSNAAKKGVKSKTEPKPQKTLKSRKANFEATSDEEEDDETGGDTSEQDDADDNDSKDDEDEDD